MKLWELAVQVQEICPSDGVNSDGVVFFKSEATLEQRTAAQALVDQTLPTIDLAP